MQRSELVSWVSHNQDQLNQRKRDSQEPVDIPVRDVDRGTREGHRVVAIVASTQTACIFPRLEDRHVLVACNGGHQTGDGQSNTILLVGVANLNPEEDCCLLLPWGQSAPMAAVPKESALYTASHWP